LLQLSIQYNQLKQLQKSGEWRIIKFKKNIRLGDTDRVVLEVCKKLCAWGEWVEIDNVFDSAKLDALHNYQNRMGLYTENHISRALINEMNISIERRMGTIICNIKRLEKLRDIASNEFILINIPSFTMYVYNHDLVQLKMKVIVGKEKNKTTTFNAMLKYIVFCPYWNIPNSILKKEILPEINHHPNYLKQFNMEWYGKGLRQKPGMDNALGLIKFIFPNRYNTYMHDTPFKALFKYNNRSYSHGCIRLENAQKLANYLLRNEEEWNEEKIKSAVVCGEEKYVTLKKSIPVHIVYLTSWVNENGKLECRKDIYKKDEQ
jgi:murein L,D-transpeptidase YcbB/YkuD